MFKKALLTILFISLFSISKAEVVKELIVTGNKRVSNETIKVYGEIDFGKNYTENDINNVINNLYSTDFFEDIQIELKNNILKINLKEYPIINQLIIIGEQKKTYREQIKKLIQLKENKPFIRPYLVKDVSIIKTLYSSLGFNFAEVETKIKTIDKDNLDY